MDFYAFPRGVLQMANFLGSGLEDSRREFRAYYRRVIDWPCDVDKARRWKDVTLGVVSVDRSTGFTGDFAVRPMDNGKVSILEPPSQS
jgi:hypothetical protein